MSGVFNPPNTIYGDVSIIGGDLLLENGKFLFGETTGGAPVSLGGVNATNDAVFGNSSGINSVILSTPSGKEISFYSAFAKVGAFKSGGLFVNAETTPIASYKQVARSWILFDMSLSTGAADLASYGIASLIDNGVGSWTANFTDTLTVSDFVALHGVDDNANNATTRIGLRAVGSCQIRAYDSADVASDEIVHLGIFSDG